MLNTTSICLSYKTPKSELWKKSLHKFKEYTMSLLVNCDDICSNDIQGFMATYLLEIHDYNPQY